MSKKVATGHSWRMSSTSKKRLIKFHEMSNLYRNFASMTGYYSPCYFFRSWSSHWLRGRNRDNEMNFYVILQSHSDSLTEGCDTYYYVSFVSRERSGRSHARFHCDLGHFFQYTENRKLKIILLAEQNSPFMSPLGWSAI